MTSGGTRVQRWERRTEVPLLLLALAFLVAYAWPVLDPRLDRDLVAALRAVSVAVWAAFAVDLVVRVSVAERRGRYLLGHWYDVALVVLPMLRPLRLLRFLTLLRLVDRSLAVGLAGRTAVYVGGAAVTAVVIGSLAVLDVEQDAEGATITTFGEALWWAVTTVTTVGYGDRVPVTTLGRFVAAGLMVVGVSLLGAITATVASWFAQRVARDELAELAEFDQRPEGSAGSEDGEALDASTGAILAAIADLRSQVAALEARLDGTARHPAERRGE